MVHPVGETSIVYKAHLSGGETVAVKLMSDSPIAEDRDKEDKKQWQKEISHEAHTLALVRHRNVIKSSACSAARRSKPLFWSTCRKGIGMPTSTGSVSSRGKTDSRYF
ncbi:unnamed protein product [Calypogeia fissa]